MSLIQQRIAQSTYDIPISHTKTEFLHKLQAVHKKAYICLYGLSILSVVVTLFCTLMHNYSHGRRKNDKKNISHLFANTKKKPDSVSTMSEAVSHIAPSANNNNNNNNDQICMHFSSTNAHHSYEVINNHSI